MSFDIFFQVTLIRESPYLVLDGYQIRRIFFLVGDCNADSTFTIGAVFDFANILPVDNDTSFLTLERI